METKKINHSGRICRVHPDTFDGMFKDLSPEATKAAEDYAKQQIESGNLEINPGMHPIVQNQICIALEQRNQPTEEQRENERILQRNVDRSGNIRHNSTKKGDKLWSNDGTDVSQCSTLEEIQHASGLDFEVEKTPAFQQLNDGSYKELKNQFHVIRTDNEHVLTSHTVSGRYTPCQNSTFMKVLDDLRVQGKISMDTAGSIDYGRKVFCIAKFTDLPDSDLKPGPDTPSDLITPYLGFWSSHDGSLPIIGKFLSFRHQCCNMSSAGWDNKGIRINIRHTKTVNEKVSDAAEVLLKIRENWVHTVELYRKLQRKELTKDQILKLIPKILGIKLDETKTDPISDLPSRQQGRILEIQDLYSDSYFGNQGKSAFDLYNAFTAYNTHRRKIRGETSRFDAVALGSGFELENRAFSVLSSLVA